MSILLAKDHRFKLKSPGSQYLSPLEPAYQKKEVQTKFCSLGHLQYNIILENEYEVLQCYDRY
jgi:hypothetical protein